MPAFEYFHTFRLAAETGTAYRGSYPFDRITSELNEAGQNGWELVNMTPHWEWEMETIEQGHYGAGEWGGQYYDVGAPFIYPEYIMSWYCTFKRPL